MKFDPNATGSAEAGIFGLPFTYEESRLVLLPVPWEVTTSYGNGTSLGPESIYVCSSQIDLFHADTGTSYEKGIFWQDKYLAAWKKQNNQLKPQAIKIKKTLESGKELDKTLQKSVDEINRQGEEFHHSVYEVSKQILKDGKMLGGVGGDHSCPFGTIKATSEFYKQDITVVHIDAHADLRDAYQGYKHSHASIMRNVMEDEFAPKKLVQLGIRDFSPGEYDYIQSREDITTFFDRDIKRQLARGQSWYQICEDLIAEIPTEKFYLSFDIDGLNPALCPNTGTPVPGGFEFDQVIELMNFLVSKGKKMVGFDLNEVSPDSPEELDCWDGNVGARVLYNMCCYALFSDSK